MTLFVRTYDGKLVGTYKYKFNSKELQEELGLNMYDYGMRNYDPALGRWMNIDPLAETSRRFSPYTYCLNNPVYYIDPDGMMAIDNDDLYIKGSQKTEAYNQLQSSSELELTMNDNGQVNANQCFTGPLTETDQKLLDATTDSNIDTVVHTADTAKTFGPKGVPMSGGAFLGSTVNADGSITAEQLTNPKTLAAKDAFLGQPTGTTMKHETLEAYQGAIDAPGAKAAVTEQDTKVYRPIHQKVANMDSNFQDAPNRPIINKVHNGKKVSFQLTNSKGETKEFSESFIKK